MNIVTAKELILSLTFWGQFFFKNDYRFLQTNSSCVTYMYDGYIKPSIGNLQGRAEEAVHNLATKLVWASSNSCPVNHGRVYRVRPTWTMTHISHQQRLYRAPSASTRRLAVRILNRAQTQVRAVSGVVKRTGRRAVAVVTIGASNQQLLRRD